MESGGFVILVEGCGRIPKEGIGCTFDGCGNWGPGRYGRGIVKNGGEIDTLVDGVVEDGVCFDVLRKLVSM